VKSDQPDCRLIVAVWMACRLVSCLDLESLEPELSVKLCMNVACNWVYFYSNNIA
jgi:hypothetical protein